MSRVALLDVNVLVALFDPAHIHHEIAHDWFADERSSGWATCALTESGMVRVIASPAYGAGARASEVIAALRRFRTSGHHHFWKETISIADESVFKSDAIAGSRQITDIYLLGLAKAHGGVLATFDKSIPIQAVKGTARDRLRIIGG